MDNDIDFDLKHASCVVTKISALVTRGWSSNTNQLDHVISIPLSIKKTGTRFVVNLKFDEDTHKLIESKVLYKESGNEL